MRAAALFCAALSPSKESLSFSSPACAGCVWPREGEFARKRVSVDGARGSQLQSVHSYVQYKARVITKPVPPSSRSSLEAYRLHLSRSASASNLPRASSAGSPRGRWPTRLKESERHHPNSSSLSNVAPSSGASPLSARLGCAQTSLLPSTLSSTSPSVTSGVGMGWCVRRMAIRGSGAVSGIGIE